MSKLDFLQGAYCPLIVPFRDGKIDFDTYGKLIERQIVEGSHGLLVNATSGEPTTLTVEERGQLVEFAIKTSNGRRPVCAGTASESFETTASLIDRFDKAGADSILVVTPFYAAPPQRGAVSYFGKLGARTRRPFLIYHIPGRAGFALAVDTVEAIKDRVPHFAGLKNTDTDVGFVTGALARLGRCCSRHPHLCTCHSHAICSLRLLVRPGITGWAQINGGNLVTNDEKGALDDWYVHNLSFWLDLRIALYTLAFFFTGERRFEPAVHAANALQQANGHFWIPADRRRSEPYQRALVPRRSAPSLSPNRQSPESAGAALD
jgi:dihydrodipicolinate synthase/N-acetylneuraminate lyase